MTKENSYPYYKKLALVLGPLLFLSFLFLSPDNELQLYQVYGISSWMIIWWMAEVVPIYITAMLPMIIFPSLGLFSIKDTFVPYANPIIFLFMGGFIIALAMEERKLHIRMALFIIKLTGTKPLGILIGMMLSTAFLSMWISNTATTVLMLPIALSVLNLLKHQDRSNQKEFEIFALALLLAIAYAANIGGTMTIIGTPPNVVFAGLFQEHHHIEIGFGQWMLVGVPTGILLLSITYLLLTKVLLKIQLTEIDGSAALFERKRLELGKMEKGERMVLIVFLLTAFLWIFKSQINVLLGSSILHNTTIAMFGGLLMFLLPVNLNKGEFVLNWKATTRLPWGILILFGGGLSLAAAFGQVGLVSNIGNWFATNVYASVFILGFALIAVSIFATEVMSNVALVTVMLPVVIAISEGMGISPYEITIPVTLAASCAFMMPISTPPNAVVYSSGLIKMHQMAKIGLVLNLISVVVLAVLVPWLIGLFFR